MADTVLCFMELFLSSLGYSLREYKSQMFLLTIFIREKIELYGKVVSWPFFIQYLTFKILQAFCFGDSLEPRLTFDLPSFP